MKFRERPRPRQLTLDAPPKPARLALWGRLAENEGTPSPPSRSGKSAAILDHKAAYAAWAKRLKNNQTASRDAILVDRVAHEPVPESSTHEIAETFDAACLFVDQRRFSSERLRPVERCVLRLADAGHSNAEIGRRFRRSERWTGEVRRLSELDRIPPSALRHETLRPIERAVVRWRDRGVDSEDFAMRFGRSAAALRRTEGFARSKLAIAACRPTGIARATG